jgi:SAM-dependent methyltransferase
MKKSMVMDVETGDLWPRMIKRMEIVKKELEGRVLDVGCGDGIPLEYFNYPNHLGVEPSMKRVEICRNKGLNVIQGEIYDLRKVVSEKFDTVICLEVFPHLMDLHSALANIHYVLKDGGKFIVSVQNAYAIDRILRKTVYKECDYHYVSFDEIQFRYLLRDNGFKVTKVYHIPNFKLSRLFTFFSKRFCDNLLFICKKK